MSTGDAGRLPSTSVAPVSLRAVIDVRDAKKKRLDELGTARWIEEAADLVHKTQTQGQAIGKLSPNAILIRAGKVSLEVPASASTAYCAPERLRGGAGDRRSDVFSLGVILWEALAHVPLFEGANDDAVKAAVLGGEINPVSEMNANVPAELDAICRKALARDPANRYQSAKVMAAEISAVLDDAGYPEGTDAIAKWIASEFPDGVVAAAPAPTPVSAPVSAKVSMSQTVMGIAPMGSQPVPQAPVVPAEPPRGAKIADALARAKSDSAPPPAKPIIKAFTPVSDRTEPLTATDIEVIALDKPTVIPLDTKKTILDPKPLAGDTLRDVKSALEAEAKQPGPLTKGWDVPAVPAEPEPAEKRAHGDSKAPASSLPSWATRPSGNTQPPPVAQPSLSTTLTGTTAPVAPSILTSAPQPSSPALKLPDAPPGATISADKPPVFSGSTTAVVGSSISTAVPTVPAPAPFHGNRTAVLGSNAIIEATNAAVSAAHPPAAPAAPAAAALPSSIVGTPALKISEAETIGVPALPMVSASPTPPTDIRAVKWDTPRHSDSGHIIKPPTLPPPIADKTPAKAAPKAHAVEPSGSKLPAPAEDDFAEPTGQGARLPASSAVPRAVSRGDRTGKGDVLAGWGVGTDSHEALGGSDHDFYEEDRQKSKKRLFMILGGAAAAAVLVVVVALAAGGGSNEGRGKDKDAVVQKPTTEPAVQPPAPEPPKPEPATAEPPKPEPTNVEPPKPAAEPLTNEPTLAKAELPKPAPDPVKVEAPKPEPMKPEPKKPEPKKPEVVAKKPEPKKPEPKKPEVVAKRPEPKKPDVRPANPPRVDAATAYKTGFQKFAKGDSLGALESFKAALATDATFAPTWRGIGLVYEKLGRKSQAATAFKRYLQLAPNAGDADQIRSRLEKLGT